MYIQYSSVYMSGGLLCTYSIHLCTCLGGSYICTVFICVHVWGALTFVQYLSVYMSGGLLHLYSIYLCTCLGGSYICTVFSYYCL